MRWIYVEVLFFHIMWIILKFFYLILFDLFLPSMGRILSQYICFFQSFVTSALVCSSSLLLTAETIVFSVLDIFFFIVFCR